MKPNPKAERARKWRLARNRARLFAVGGLLGALTRDLDRTFGRPAWRGRYLGSLRRHGMFR